MHVITVGVEPSAPSSEWNLARKKIDEVRRSLESGMSFEALARAHSTDPSRDTGGDLGLAHEGRLIAEFERALENLRPGEVSAVVSSIHGFHLLRLTAVTSPVQKTFDEVKEQLAKDLTMSRCAAEAAEWTRRLRESARVEILPGPGAPSDRRR